MESKRKHGFLKAALPAFAMLLVAVLSLTTVTFAWFTQGDSAKVDSFQLDVAAGGGLEISTTGNAGSWKSVLTADDIKELAGVKDYVHSEEGENKKLAPVSTIGKVGEDQKIEFFSADIDTSDAHQITTTRKVTEGFLSFDIYFRNASSEEKQILIKDTEFTQGTESYAHLAARLAFVNAGSRNVNAADLSDFSGGDKAGEATVKIFEPNCETHTQDAITDYQTNGPADSRGSFDGEGKLAYFGVEAASSETFGRYEAKAGVLSAVDTVTIEEKKAELDETQTTEFFTLAKNAVTKITVYIWIEGQDADCTNTISNNSFKASLKFTVKEA